VTRAPAGLTRRHPGGATPLAVAGRLEPPHAAASNPTAVVTASSCPVSPAPVAAGPDTTNGPFGVQFRGNPTSIATIVSDTKEYRAVAGRPREAGSAVYGNAVIEVISTSLDPCKHPGNDDLHPTGYPVPDNPVDARITARHGPDITVTGSDGGRHVFDVPAARWLS